MFTGLIEEVGTVRSLATRDGSATLSIRCGLVIADAEIGDSIAVNGVCLTVTALDEGTFEVEMMGETLDRSALGDLQEGSPVNLERAMAADGRLGGHMVQGHVDGVGEIIDIDPREEWTMVTYRMPASLAPYVVEKGSISIDGTSLTVVGTDGDTFGVGLIPHTLEVTTHGSRTVGDRVNLEVDVIAKYVEKQVAAHLEANRAGGQDG